MKICPKCGFQNEDGALFCEDCGARLDQPARPPAGDAGETGHQTGPAGWNGGQPDQQGWTGGQTGPQTGPKGWSGGRPGSIPASGAAAPPRRPRKPLKKPGKNHIIAAVEALLLVVAIVVFWAVGSSRTSPTRVTEQYFRAALEGDWDRVCQLAQVPDSPFLTQEGFDRYLAEMQLDSRELASLSVRQQPDYGNQGTMGNYVREVEVSMMFQDSPEIYTEDVTLTRGDSREMFLFRGWQVADNMPFLARNFWLEVPAGATLVVDGLVADESLCQEHLESTDLYRLDLFVGNHELTVVTPLGSQSQTYGVWEDDDYLYAGDLTMTEDLQNQLEGQAKTLLQQLFNAALANSDFSAISGSYTGEALEVQMPELYEEIRQNCFGDPNWRVLKITLSNFAVWNCNAFYDEQGQLRVNLELEFDSAVDTARLENSYLQSTDTDRNSGAVSIEFLYQDGNWIPSSVWNLYW